MKKIISLVLCFCIAIAAIANTKSSKTCKEFIKEQEKFSATAYWDGNAYSIGYGHHSKSICKNDKIDHSTALSYLESDIKNAEKYVNYLLNKLPYKYKFSQGFIDGFTSFVYNVGVGNAEKSIFYKRLQKCRVKNGVMNNEDYNFTIAAIKTSCISANGHIKRRNGEYKMMAKR